MPTALRGHDSIRITGKACPSKAMGMAPRGRLTNLKIISMETNIVITGALIGLAVWGLFFGVLNGYVPAFSRPPIRGWRARCIGLVAMLPLPMAYALGYTWGVITAY